MHGWCHGLSTGKINSYSFAEFITGLYTMCGRFSLDASNKALNAHYGTHEKLELKPRFNVSPNTYCPIVRLHEDHRILISSYWGLVPHWARGDIKVKPINAKAETVKDKPYFRYAYKHQRCLVPATGYYEWKGKEGKKQPYYIKPAGADIFSFAGLWETWEKGEEPLTSFTIITADASEQLTDIHNRMPVIIDPENYDGWLVEGDASLLSPSKDEFEFYKVSTYVNKPTNEGRDLINPV
jgi:putative SOS response-associated peptidase YedK